MPEEFDGKSAAERELIDALFQLEREAVDCVHEYMNVDNLEGASYWRGRADALAQVGRMLNGR